MKRIVITGAAGLIGWHAWSRLHAENCAAGFKGLPKPYDLIPLGHTEFNNAEALQKALTGADAVLHYAGVNRGEDASVEAANPAIAQTLVDALKDVKADPHVVYANSIHASRDIPYGRSKRIAGEILDAFASRYTNIILPHIFGEGAKPYYNNVTATLIDQLLKGETPTVNPDGVVNLLHAGDAAQVAIEAVNNAKTGDIAPEVHTITIPALLEKIMNFQSLYSANVFPDMSDSFDLKLFNCYRNASYPDNWPKQLKLNTDDRGMLFEAVKGGNGGQSFLSTTKPGITRGDHFHVTKIERFLVVQGEAIIRMRKIGSDKVWEFPVTGAVPSVVDMPTLHTHSIENVGEGELLTLFWSHEIFDHQNPDTYADRVIL